MLGIMFPPTETRHDVLVRAAVRAEELGYDAYFVPEGWGFDALCVVADIAGKTERITLGTGVLNPWSRSAATLAMAAATLTTMAGPRFILGLGTSSRQLVEGLHDVPFDAPLDRLRTVVTQLRDLVGGDRIGLSRTAHARPLRLGVSSEPVPIFLAALGPASIRLSGEIADGWMPLFVPASRAGDLMAVLQEGAARRPGEERCLFCPTIGTAVSGDEGKVREQAAWWLGFYLTSMGPLYARTLERLGFDAEVKAVQAANPGRSPFVVPPEAGGLVDELLVSGNPDTARARLARWYELGADMPVVSIPPGRSWDEIDFTLVALSPPDQRR